MKVEIKSIAGSTLFDGDFSSIANAVEAAVASRANLGGAYLEGANLEGAYLGGANLEGANLYGANLRRLLAVRTILPEGDLIGYKRLANGKICKLRIPADAKRVGGLVGRKCRAEYAIVLEGEGHSRHDRSFSYKVGSTVRPTKPFDDNPLQECRSGIHFFITKEEAEAYS